MSIANISSKTGSVSDGHESRVKDSRQRPGDSEISKALAMLDIVGINSTKLFGIIAEEVRAILQVNRVVVWYYIPSLHRLVVEQEGVGAEALYLTQEDVDLLIQDSAIWDDDLDGLRLELVIKSFGLSGKQNQLILSLPACGIGCSALLLCQVSDIQQAKRVVQSSKELLGQIGSMISNYFALQRARHHEAQLEALYETAGEISAELDLDSVLKAIVTRAKNLVRVPISYIMLVDHELSDLYMCTTIGTKSREFATLRLAVGSGLGGRTAKEIKPFYTKDYLNDQHFQHLSDVDEAVRLEGIKSILGVPLKALQKFVGVLYVADRAERVFSGNDVEVLSSLAHHATLAVSNSALYESVANALNEVERMQRMAAEQYQKLQASDALNRILSELIALGEGIDGVTRQLADLVEGHVVVCDERGKAISSAGEPEDDFSCMLVSKERKSFGSAGGEIDKAFTRLKERESFVVAGSSTSRRKECLVVPVTVRGDVLGSIWIRVGPERLAEQQAILEGATRVIALELAHSRALAALEARMHGEWLEALLSCRPETVAAIVRRGIELGVDVSKPHYVGVVSLLEDDSNVVGGATGAKRRDTQDDLVKALAAEDECAFAGVVSGLVVALIPSSHTDPGATLSRLLARKTTGELSYHAAVSDVVREVTDYGDAFDEARRGLLLAPEQARQWVIDLAKAGILPLLFKRGGDAELRRFVEEVLGAVISYDEHHEGNLCMTLQAYAETGGSAGRTATILGVHVNTVYYRLRKLETLLGREFVKPERLLDIQVAFLARRFLSTHVNY